MKPLGTAFVYTSWCSTSIAGRTYAEIMWAMMMPGWPVPEPAYAPTSWINRPRKPRSLPALSDASSSSITEPCPCAVVAPSSLLVATQRTGFCRRHAASAVSTSSGKTLPLAPKPPPTSSASTRTFASSMPSVEATARLTPNTFCAEAGDDLGQVVGSPHRDHSRHRCGRGPVDRPDAGVGQGRAAEGGVKQTLDLNVPRVAAATGDQPLVFDATRAPADVGRHGNY